MPGLAAVFNSGKTAEDLAVYNELPEDVKAGLDIPVVGFGIDSGGKIPCCITPPFETLGTPTVANVQIEGAFPITNGDILTPAPGSNVCTVIPTPCTNERSALATSVRVLINGRAPCVVGDFLNEAAGITIASGATRVTIGA